MRVLTAVFTALLLLCYLGASALADDARTPPADPPATGEGDGEGDGGDGNGSSTSEEEDEEEPEEVPEGVRRTRPRTAEQERDYKQRKNREDIYLNAPEPTGPDAENDGVYNPADWLIFDTRDDLSRYIVQDATGAIVGRMTLSLAVEEDPLLGQVVRLRRRDDTDPAVETDLIIHAADFKPVFKESRRDLGRSPAGPAGDDPGAEAVPELYQDIQLLQAEYQFDRVRILHRAGGISVRRAMRQMPFSYDIDTLPLLLRQLDFLDPDWPFEVAVCDPGEQHNLPLVVSQPGKEEHVLTAEAETYRCWVLEVRVGEATETYWVERLAPRRLVKYTEGELTYTLAEYLERE